MIIAHDPAENQRRGLVEVFSEREYLIYEHISNQVSYRIVGTAPFNDNDSHPQNSGNNLHFRNSYHHVEDSHSSVILEHICKNHSSKEKKAEFC